MALLVSASSIGGVAGGLLISAWGGLKRKRVYGLLLPMLLRLEDMEYLDGLALASIREAVEA